MNNSKGFAPLFIILAVILVGGAGVAVVQRNTLKSFFEKGDKPTQQQFGATIDSTTTMHDDGQQAAPAAPSQKPASPDVSGRPGAAKPPLVLSEKQFQFSLDTKQIVTFHWEPAQGAATYRLKVWQLMQGQSGAAAMRSNKPIVTRDVENISEISVDSIYTGPCRPPYLCDFVWSVEALSKADATGRTAPATGAVLEPSATLEAGASAVTETKTR
jgi:hypothetical protein